MRKLEVPDNFRAFLQGRIITKDAFEQTERVAQLVTTAEAEMELYRSQQEQQIRKLRNEQIRAGYQVGCVQGWKKFNNLCQELQPRVDQVNSELAALVRVSLNKILSELPPNQIIEDTVEQIVLSQIGAPQITLVVSPGELTMFKEVLIRRSKQQHDSPKLILETDPKLEPGNVWIYTRDSIIDMSIQTRVETLCSAIEGQPGPNAADQELVE